MSLILSGSEGLSDVDGTAATPAIRGTDTNTGIFFPAADTIAFAEGGVESMRLDSSGNLGIGTTSLSNGVRTVIQGSQTGGAPQTSGTTQTFGLLRLQGTSFTSALDFGTNGGNYAWIQSTDQTNLATNYSLVLNPNGGNVGIGTTSPATRLQVNGQTRVSDGTTNIDIVCASSTGFIGTQTNAPLVLRTNDIERARIDSSGNLLVGTTIAVARTVSEANGASLAMLSLRNSDTGSASQGISLFYRNGSLTGSISNTNTTTAYNTSSDYRLKHDIAPMTGALAKVVALNPVTYKWNADNSNGEGFIAHELAEVVPQCVTGEKDAVDADGNPQYQGIDTSFLVATLTAAIQELKAELDAVKTELAALKGTA